MNAGSPIQSDIPKTPSNDSRQRTPLSTGVMSSSLKERLKKCGRYHPATPPSSRTLSSHSLTASQRQLPRKILVESTHLHENTLPTSETRPVNCEASGVKESPKQSFSTTAIHHLKTCSPSTNTESLAEDCANGVELSIVKIPDFNVTQSGVKVCTKYLIADKHLPARDFVELQQYDKSNQNLYNTGKSETELHMDKKQLQTFLMERKETLRKLHMVELYRKKNNLTELQGLIDKWRSASQQAVLDLHHLVAEPRPSLSELVKQLGIDSKLVRFDEIEECFN